MLPFLVNNLFYDFRPFRVLQMMTPISSCLHTMHPFILVYTHNPTCCFSRFCTLLCAIITVNTAYTIYFVLIHHCTNSLSSLHIFVHHCTFYASLHTKTSPAICYRSAVLEAFFSGRAKLKERQGQKHRGIERGI